MPEYVNVNKSVNSMKQGQSFGELALITNKPRAATIRCATGCHFAILNRESYHKCLGKIEQKRRQNLIDFVMELPLFAEWTKT